MKAFSGFDSIDWNPRILVLDAQPGLVSMVHDMGQPPCRLGSDRGVAGTDLYNPVFSRRGAAQNDYAVLTGCQVVRDVRGSRQMICTPLPVMKEICVPSLSL